MAYILGKQNEFYQAEVGSTNNALMVVPGYPIWPASGGTGGGHYSVSFAQSAVTAASLAADTPLLAMRLSTSSQRKAFIYKIRIGIAISTFGTSALVPGSIGLQRFSGATHSGGLSRTVNRMSEVSGTTSDMTDIRDSNAALTDTSVVYGTIISTTLLPLAIGMNGSSGFDWTLEPPAPIVLVPGEGLVLRTQTVMPATQTWIYSYSIYWCEE
jgi:hypothetical protein